MLRGWTIAAMAVWTVVSHPVEAGCSPVGADTDIFPSTATFVIDPANIFGEPFVIRLSSSGQPDGSVQRDAQVGDTIDTELVQLELAGFHPQLGVIAVREDPALASTGQIRDVVQAPTCELASGQASFDLFLEIDVSSPLAETWVTASPVRVEASLTSLPVEDTRFEVLSTAPVALVDKSSGNPRGDLFFARHHVAPAFPEPGMDCYEQGLLTADVFMNQPQSGSSLIGFGPVAIEREGGDPGGTCSQSGGPCQSQTDCPILQTCQGPTAATRFLTLDSQGSDSLMGSWTLSIQPVGGDSDCCDAHLGPGCSDVTCEMLVCATDGFCCSTDWDQLCADFAASESTCSDECLIPGAHPSVGALQSVSVERTYPASEAADLFVEISSSTQGMLHNEDPIPVTLVPTAANVPHDPGSEYRSTAAAVVLYSGTNQPVGEISNVVQALQPPVDCEPPPAAADSCHEVELSIELSLPACPTEPLTLSGQIRIVRDAAEDTVGLGQEVAEAVLAKAELSGTSPCAGPLDFGTSPTVASPGTVASLAPEEFFPAEAFLDLFFELDTSAGQLKAGPARVSTAALALPFPGGQRFLGPANAVDLLDETDSPVGQALPLELRILAGSGCPAAATPTVRFAGPGDDTLQIGIPGGGAGLSYDLVRGDLQALVAGGSFASASCISPAGPAEVVDPATPMAGNGFFYVSRERLGTFVGSWNGDGAQVADRDPLITACP